MGNVCCDGRCLSDFARIRELEAGSLYKVLPPSSDDATARPPSPRETSGSFSVMSPMQALVIRNRGPFQRKKKGGWKTQGRGKHTIKSLPKRVLDPPPPTAMILRARSTTTRDRNLQFRGAVSTGGSPLDFLLFLQYLCAI